MISTILSVFVFLALLVIFALLSWKARLTGFRRTSSDGADTRQGPANQAFRYGIDELVRTRENPLSNGLGLQSRAAKEERARAYLERILAVTGAAHVDNAYVLDVGKVQFQLWDQFVRRLQNPEECRTGFEETCFYLVPCGMPKTEEIATVLLHLSNNPALFDKWARQNGVPFKADGRTFKRAR